MNITPSGPTAEQLRTELVKASRDIRGLRETIRAMRVHRKQLRARLGAARATEKRDAAESGPDVNRDVGGEG